MKQKLSLVDYIRAANMTGCEIAAIKAVAEVESSGDGFLPNDSPKILFERHIFRRLTSGAYDKQYPDISNKVPGGYGVVSVQHDRLNKAASLNRDAALKSASWGKFQIMGFNHKLAGFDTLQGFINAMYQSEGAQLDAFCKFLINTGAVKWLREKNWAKFAEAYNGKNYKINNYDVKLMTAYKRHLAV